ncbi:efflux RND transporter periplasmic adaptor subunit [Candidatus Nitrotoga sp. M5]|uniref:efflux RND transporter periplasmic adaptor subunit n=1 Tax=Candidatus Nitrotoga sp. M5 TaxID=2890409 RepID=UPI001EF2FF3D|nr:efflux RND transporter periplasmic adaptor subunit [Candidatus Nitrotoga sp. M5]CAH1385762.1 Efflux transporter periplasmic adaptor subunit [Candidatus Nitrotoga sp. M5]
MNKKNLRFHLCACVITMAYALTATAQATNRSVQFIVPNNQIQILGIKTVALQSQIDLIKARFPAEVVASTTARQVVSSSVAGLVAQLLVQQNQAVQPGTPLVRIASSELGQLQLQLLQATARTKLARQSALREQALFDEGITPKRRTQEAQSILMEAEAALHQAKAALRLSGMSAATIQRIADSGKPQDSITLTATQVGIVTSIEVKPGQRIEPTTSLLQISQTDSLRLNIQLPMSDNTNWPAGTKVKVIGRDVAARILSVSPIVSSSSQIVQLRAEVEGNTSQIRAGEFVTVELPLTATPGSWDVPLSAVAHDGNHAFVFVRTSQGFEARPVKVVVSAGQLVRVQGALEVNEQIAISGVVVLKGAWLNAMESK